MRVEEKKNCWKLFVIFGSEIKSAICGELASLANSIVTDQKLELSQSSQNQHLFIFRTLKNQFQTLSGLQNLFIAKLIQVLFMWI